MPSGWPCDLPRRIQPHGANRGPERLPRVDQLAEKRCRSRPPRRRENHEHHTSQPSARARRRGVPFGFSRRRRRAAAVAAGGRFRGAARLGSEDALAACRWAGQVPRARRVGTLAVGKDADLVVLSGADSHLDPRVGRDDRRPVGLPGRVERRSQMRGDRTIATDVDVWHCAVIVRRPAPAAEKPKLATRRQGRYHLRRRTDRQRHDSDRRRQDPGHRAARQDQGPDGLQVVDHSDKFAMPGWSTPTATSAGRATSTRWSTRPTPNCACST